MSTTAIMSGLEFDALPYEEGRRWELLEGNLIEVSSATPRHQKIVSKLFLALQRYLDGGTGEVFMDVEFALSPLLRLRPDVCVLLAEKAQSLDPDVIPISGAPDLAVEVISPTERASESHDKVLAYLRNGTAEVWQVFPKSRTVEIHRSAGGRSLDAQQQITSGLLPGFEVSVASFFE